MSHTAVLVIDMLNAYQHEDAELLIANVAAIIDPLAGLVSVAREREGVDLIYVNDNYGDFTADHDDIIRSALQGARPDLVKPIVPDKYYRFSPRCDTVLSTRQRWAICWVGWRPSG